MSTSPVLKVTGVVVAILVAALLLAGQFGVIYRGLRAPTGYDQSRLHWNTKNSTRFSGADSGAVAQLVARAVYPATEAANTPSTVFIYDPADWQGGLAVTPLLRSLNALLIPATAAAGTLEQLRVNGQETQLRIVAVGEATAPAGETAERISAQDVLAQLEQAGAPPRRVLIVDANDPGTALLAAPWAAYSGDLIVFDAADAPADLPRYALGSVSADGATRIDGGSAAATAVEFAKFGDRANNFGWAMHGADPTGYRAWTLSRANDPATALLSANLARRGKVGPLLWTNERTLPAVVDAYLWSQRPAFFNVPNAGPFHHIWVLGDLAAISFPAQAQTDYAVEIGPYRMKGPGAAAMDALAAVWVALGIASALWVAFHQARFFPRATWVMRLAWPLLSMMMGPFGIPAYWLAYRRPVIEHGQMTMWDRPLWLQGLAASASSVGFGGALMVATAFVMTTVGLPMVPNNALGDLFWLGAPMILVMAANYIVAVLISWPLYQTPMQSMLHGVPYGRALPIALPIVLVSMASVSLGMFPGMWWLMMLDLPMMPDDESILWFGVMFFTVFLGFLISWPFNYALVRAQRKSGMM